MRQRAMRLQGEVEHKWCDRAPVRDAGTASWPQEDQKQETNREEAQQAASLQGRLSESHDDGPLCQEHG